MFFSSSSSLSLPHAIHILLAILLLAAAHPRAAMTNNGAGLVADLAYGTGADGDLTIGSGTTKYVNEVYTHLTAAASSGATTLTVASTSGFAAGDAVLVHRIQQDDDDTPLSTLGRWDLVHVTARGATSLSISPGLASGTGTIGTVVLRVPQYRNVLLESGGKMTTYNQRVGVSHNTGSYFGHVAFLVSGRLTLDGGVIDAIGVVDGGNGASAGENDGDSGYGSVHKCILPAVNIEYRCVSRYAIGTSGGAGYWQDDADNDGYSAGGGGGADPGGSVTGYTAGFDPTFNGYDYGGRGGNAFSHDDEKYMMMGGGGGGGGGDGDGDGCYGGSGGDGGGVIFIRAHEIVHNERTGLKAYGTNGASSSMSTSNECESGAGGGGGGGTVMIAAEYLRNSFTVDGNLNVIDVDGGNGRSRQGPNAQDHTMPGSGGGGDGLVAIYCAYATLPSDQSDYPELYPCTGSTARGVMEDMLYDGTYDHYLGEFLVDYCPDDPAKTDPGLCGCGRSEPVTRTGTSDTSRACVFMDGADFVCEFHGSHSPSKWCAYCNVDRDDEAWTAKNNMCLVGELCFNNGDRRQVGGSDWKCEECAPSLTQYDYSFVANRCRLPAAIGGTGPQYECYSDNELYETNNCLYCDGTGTRTSGVLRSRPDYQTCEDLDSCTVVDHCRSGVCVTNVRTEPPGVTSTSSSTAALGVAGVTLGDLADSLSIDLTVTAIGGVRVDRIGVYVGSSSYTSAMGGQSVRVNIKSKADGSTVYTILFSPSNTVFKEGPIAYRFITPFVLPDAFRGTLELVGLSSASMVRLPSPQFFSASLCDSLDSSDLQSSMALHSLGDFRVDNWFLWDTFQYGEDKTPLFPSLRKWCRSGASDASHVSADFPADVATKSHLDVRTNVPLAAGTPTAGDFLSAFVPLAWQGPLSSRAGDDAYIFAGLANANVANDLTTMPTARIEANSGGIVNLPADGSWLAIAYTPDLASPTGFRNLRVEGTLTATDIEVEVALVAEGEVQSTFTASPGIELVLEGSFGDVPNDGRVAVAMRALFPSSPTGTDQAVADVDFRIVDGEVQSSADYALGDFQSDFMTPGSAKPRWEYLAMVDYEPTGDVANGLDVPSPIMLRRLVADGLWTQGTVIMGDRIDDTADAVAPASTVTLDAGTGAGSLPADDGATLTATFRQPGSPKAARLAVTDSTLGGLSEDAVVTVRHDSQVLYSETCSTSCTFDGTVGLVLAGSHVTVTISRATPGSGQPLTWTSFSFHLERPVIAGGAFAGLDVRPTPMCDIAGTCYLDGAIRPGYPCQGCDVLLSDSGWSARVFETCGGCSADQATSCICNGAAQCVVDTVFTTTPPPGPVIIDAAEPAPTDPIGDLGAPPAVIPPLAPVLADAPPAVSVTSCDTLNGTGLLLNASTSTRPDNPLHESSLYGVVVDALALIMDAVSPSASSRIFFGLSDESLAVFNASGNNMTAVAAAIDDGTITDAGDLCVSIDEPTADLAEAVDGFFGSAGTLVPVPVLDTLISTPVRNVQARFAVDLATGVPTLKTFGIDLEFPSGNINDGTVAWNGEEAICSFLYDAEAETLRGVVLVVATVIVPVSIAPLGYFNASINFVYPADDAAAQPSFVAELVSHDPNKWWPVFPDGLLSVRVPGAFYDHGSRHTHVEVGIKVSLPGFGPFGSYQGQLDIYQPLVGDEGPPVETESDATFPDADPAAGQLTVEAWAVEPVVEYPVLPGVIGLIPLRYYLNSASSVMTFEADVRLSLPGIGSFGLFATKIDVTTSESRFQGDIDLEFAMVAHAENDFVDFIPDYLAVRPESLMVSTVTDTMEATGQVDATLPLFGPLGTYNLRLVVLDENETNFASPSEVQAYIALDDPASAPDVDVIPGMVSAKVVSGHFRRGTLVREASVSGTVSLYNLPFLGDIGTLDIDLFANLTPDESGFEFSATGALTVDIIPGWISATIRELWVSSFESGFRFAADLDVPFWGVIPDIVMALDFDRPNLAGDVSFSLSLGIPQAISMNGLLDKLGLPLELFDGFPLPRRPLQLVEFNMHGVDGFTIVVRAFPGEKLVLIPDVLVVYDVYVRVNVGLQGCQSGDCRSATLGAPASSGTAAAQGAANGQSSTSGADGTSLLLEFEAKWVLGTNEGDVKIRLVDGSWEIEVFFEELSMKVVVESFVGSLSPFLMEFLDEFKLMDASFFKTVATEILPTDLFSMRAIALSQFLGLDGNRLEIASGRIDFKPVFAFQGSFNPSNVLGYIGAKINFPSLGDFDFPGASPLAISMANMDIDVPSFPELRFNSVGQPEFMRLGVDFGLDLDFRSSSCVFMCGLMSQLFSELSRLPVDVRFLQFEGGLSLAMDADMPYDIELGLFSLTDITFALKIPIGNMARTQFSLGTMVRDLNIGLHVRDVYFKIAYDAFAATLKVAGFIPGWIENFFGLPFMNIGNVGVDVVIIGASEVVFQGEMAIGSDCIDSRGQPRADSGCIVGQAAVSTGGIPWGYFEIHNLKASRVFRCIEPRLPKLPGPIGEIGFAGPVIVSASTRRRMLPNGVQVYSGFFVEGYFSVFGMGARARVSVPFSDAMGTIIETKSPTLIPDVIAEFQRESTAELSVVLDPIDAFGGILQLRRSRTSEDGPTFWTTATMRPSEGYFTISGGMDVLIRLSVLEVELSVEFSEKGFTVKTYADFFGIRCHYDLTATIPGRSGFTGASYHIKLSLDLSSFNQALDIVTGYANDLLDEVSSYARLVPLIGSNIVNAIDNVRPILDTRLDYARLESRIGTNFQFAYDIGGRIFGYDGSTGRVVLEGTPQEMAETIWSDVIRPKIEKFAYIKGLPDVLDCAPDEYNSEVFCIPTCRAGYDNYLVQCVEQCRPGYDDLLFACLDLDIYEKGWSCAEEVFGECVWYEPDDCDSGYTDLGLVCEKHDEYTKSSYTPSWKPIRQCNGRYEKDTSAFPWPLQCWEKCGKNEVRYGPVCVDARVADVLGSPSFSFNSLGDVRSLAGSLGVDLGPLDDLLGLAEALSKLRP